MTKQNTESPIVSDEILSALMSLDEDPTNDRVDAIAKYVDPTARVTGDRAGSVRAIVDDVRRALQASEGRFRSPESRTMDSGKALLDDALALTGGSRTEWVAKTEFISPWEFCEVTLPGLERTVRAGVSSGGVVAFNGDPFTPDAKRTMNVNLEPVVTSITLLHQRLLKFEPDPEGAKGAAQEATVADEVGNARKQGFKPTREMVDAAEGVLFAMAFRDTVSPIVVEYQTRILGEGKWTVREEFEDEPSGEMGEANVRPAKPEPITDPKNAWQMSDEDFTVYNERCQAAARTAGLKVARDGNCPKLEAEDDVRVAERRLIDSMVPITNLPARTVTGLHPRDYDRFVGLTLDQLRPFVDAGRMKARMAALRDGQESAAESLSM